MKSLAIIPARGGSKRLPAKHKLLFRGRPLIDHTILAAKESGAFDKVVVSSDDPEILQAARKQGVEADSRPIELAGDTASVAQVCLELLERMPGYDLLCCLYATAPLRTASDIRMSQEVLFKTQASAVICATRYLHPAYQALRPDDKNGWRLAFPELGEKRSQDLPAMKVDNGSCYWVRVGDFLKNKSFYLSPMALHEMPIERSIDLDTPEDWALLQKLESVS
ncbi:MAG: acylneuraminate cytidylyltransferase family protein [Verrucomicrobiae bacterium]|nr:acylneuraminate cytidylyltransferase family protein [Verrucomicrobiae bacterium]